MAFGRKMLLTYEDALEVFGTRFHIRKAVSEGRLHHVGYNRYSLDEYYPSLNTLLTLYPMAIVTGLTAYYIHGLTDVIPEEIDLATKRGGTTIKDAHARQYFIPEEWLEIGKTVLAHDGVDVVVYDLERMLLELARNKNKLPYDVYKEVIASYRKRADSLDIYKLQDYAGKIPRGGSYLNTIMKEVF